MQGCISGQARYLVFEETGTGELDYVGECRFHSQIGAVIARKVHGDTKIRVFLEHQIGSVTQKVVLEDIRK